MNQGKTSIPGFRLEAKTDDSTSLTFEFTDNPNNFDLIIWDVDQKDTCWLEIKDENGDLINNLSVRRSFLIQNDPAPIPNWDSQNQTLSSPDDSNDGSHRNYMVVQFVDQPVSEIDITLSLIHI